MSSQVGGIIGGLIGAVGAYYTGNYELIAEGYTLGSGAQALIAPPHTYGPTLNDLKIQTSSYGVDIPERWGAGRQSANVIFQTDLEQHAVDDSSKGGPTNTPYKYTFNTALGLCKGPILGIGRIWANKKVWYDARPNNPNPLNDPRIGQVRVYLGTEEQEADPLLEALTGPDSPAYRGLAYVVLEGVDGTDTQGRIQWEFEVFADGDTGVHYQNIAALTDTDLGDSGLHGRAWIDARKIYWWRPSGSTEYFYRSVDGLPAEFVRSLEGVTDSDLCPVNTKSWPSSALVYTRLDPTLDGGVLRQLLRVDFLENDHGTRTVFNVAFSEYTSLLGANALVAYDQDSDVTAASKREHRVPPSTVHYFAERVVVSTGGSPVFGGIPPALLGYDESPIGQHVIGTDEIVCALAAADGQVFALIHDGTNMRLRILSQVDASVLHDYIGPAMAPDLTLTDTQESLHVDGNKVYAWCQTDGAVWRWSLVDGSYTTLATGVGCLGDDGFGAGALGGNRIYIDDDSMINSTEDNVSLDGAHPIFRIQRVIFNAPEGDAVLLSTIVSDICAEAGLTSDDIDVTELTDLVSGYTRSKQMTARAAIEPLQQAYFFDAVESDFKLKFVKRGGAIAATIPLDDRAAHVAGEDMPDHLKIVRANELEQPSMVDVNYVDASADYLVGDQYERRLTKKVDNSVQLNLPINFTADQAKQIAATSLYSAWLTNTFSFSTGRKWAHLEPTDVVLLPTEEATYAVRLTKKTEQPNGVIDWEGVEEDAEVYSQTLVGTPLSYVPTTLKVFAGSDLNLMDIPILRDDDDNSGAYAKATPQSDYWTGAALARTDGGSPLALGSISKPSVAGFALTALADYSGIGAFDESSSVDVQIGSGSLVSVTRAQALAGMNAFLIGGGVAGQEEIVIARDVTLLATKRYRLSGLLRGRRATPTGGHAIGDRVVKLESAGLVRFDEGIGDLGVSHKYAAISFGRTLATSDQKTFTNTGVGMKPFPPIHLGAGLNGAGDVIFRCTPQTRYAAPLRDFVGAPLGETSERYTVDIGTTSGMTTIVRTLTVTSPTATYAAADMAADTIAGLPFPFYYCWTQWSDRIGPGFPSEVRAFNQVPANSFDFSKLVLGLHGDGTNGSTTFTDVHGHTVVALGSNTISTAQSKFGGASIAFNNDGGLNIGGDVALTDFDFPADFWISTFARASELTGGTGYRAIYDCRVAGDSASGFFFGAHDGHLLLHQGASDQIVDSGTLPLDTWIEVALGRHGVDHLLFVGGTLVGTWSPTLIHYTDARCYIGQGSASAGGGTYWHGWMDDFLVLKGQCLHTDDYTPRTSPFPDS